MSATLITFNSTLISLIYIYSRTHPHARATVFSLVVAGAVTIGLYFVRNSLENLVLSCIFEALTSLGISTVYCVMVDLFPTNLRFVFSPPNPCANCIRFYRQNSLISYAYRVMAAALSLTFGRGGALIGNLIFGFLIDLNCVIPIVLFSTMLFSEYCLPLR